MGHSNVAPIEVAPEAQCGHIADPDYGVEPAAREHAFVAHQQTIELLILTQTRQRLGIDGSAGSDTEIAHAIAMTLGQAADQNQFTVRSTLRCSSQTANRELRTRSLIDQRLIEFDIDVQRRSAIPSIDIRR